MTAFQVELVRLAENMVDRDILMYYASEIEILARGLLSEEQNED